MVGHKNIWRLLQATFSRHKFDENVAFDRDGSQIVLVQELYRYYGVVV